MKKVLLNTTALLATAGMSLLVTAGIASADVSISGSAEIGVVGGDPNETQFWSDIDVNFSLSGETDNGLSFGASIDLDEVSGGIPATGGAPAVYISGAFGKLTIGDTDGAFDFALAEAIIGGTINDVQEHAGYSGNSGLDGTHQGQVARYDNTVGALSFALSVEIDDSGASADAVIGGGVKFAAGNIGVGVGFQQNATDTIAGVSVDASIGDIQVIANYADLDTAGNSIGFALGYSMDALLLAMNWGQIENAGGLTNTGWGVIANLDMGGGAVLKAGYGSSDRGFLTSPPPPALGDSNVWSVGLGLSF